MLKKIDELRLMNSIILNTLKENKKDYRNQLIIKDILEDDTCFFKMDKEEAFIILNNLEISDEYKEKIYKELISFDNFYNLYNENKITLDDKDLKIKYKIYDNNVF